MPTVERLAEQRLIRGVILDGGYQMIAVTEKAKQYLKAVLTAKTSDPETGFRLIISESGDLLFTGDRERAGDQLVLHDGSKVLLADENVIMRLGTVTIDCSQEDDNPRIFLAHKPETAPSSPQTESEQSPE